MTQSDYTLPELLEAMPAWRLVSDCYKGQKAIESQGDIYLPDPSPFNEDPVSRKKRYSDYQKRAVYYNVVRRTAKALSGLVFAKYPLMELPLPEMETNIDGAGTNITQQARQALLMLLLKGRGGLLVDYPVNDGATAEQVKTLGYRPIIRIYEPEHVINWRYSAAGGHKRLSLLVIKEKALKSDDGYKAEYEDRLLVLRLVNGVVVSKQMRKYELGGWEILSEITPTDINGKNLTEIPFTFFGADDNDETIDDAPLYDLAVLNIAHYRNSADYEESNFITAQPSLFITGVSDSWYRDVLKDNPIRLGSRTANVLGQGAEAFFLQAQSNSVLFESMNHKESQMVALGAKLIEPSGGNKTATEISADNADNTSVLSTIANNLSDAYTIALRFCNVYLGKPDDEAVFTLNTRFETAKMTTAERQQLITEWQSGAISFAEMRSRLVEDEIAIQPDPDLARGEIEADKRGLNLDD